MDRLNRLQEAIDTDRLGVSIKNLDTTIETIISLLKKDVAPSSDQLMTIWKCSDRLQIAYGLAEKARANQVSRAAGRQIASPDVKSQEAGKKISHG
jgi:hypothetical protein